MPEMDGIKATRQIRNVHDASALQIIGLTVEASLKRHVHFMNAGMNGMLTKPFTKQQLQGILAQHMPEAALAAIPNESSPESHENESNKVPLGDEEKLESLSKILKTEVLENLLGKAEESLTTRMEGLRRGVEIVTQLMPRAEVAAAETID